MTHDNQPAAPGAFKPAEAAAWLSISRTQLYRLLKSGEIRARQCGTRLLISRKALEDYLDADAVRVRARKSNGLRPMKPEPRSLVEQMQSTGPDKPKQLLFVWRDTIRCDTTITAEDYGVALEYSMYADTDGTNCWPGEARVAGALRRAERSVRRHVAKLVKRGWLTLEQRGYGGAPGRSKPAVYRLTIPQDIGHTCPVCPTVKGHWCPRHRTWVAETPDTGDQDIGHSYVHLPPITSPDLSYIGEGSKRDSERDELEEAFASEDGQSTRDEVDELAQSLETCPPDDVDVLKSRCIDIYMPWNAARDHCIRTIDALRCYGGRGIADSVISEAIGLAAEQGDKDPAKRTLAYLFGTAVGQYRRATGGAA